MPVLPVQHKIRALSRRSRKFLGKNLLKFARIHPGNVSAAPARRTEAVAFA